jgi:hypothetical protein
MQKIILPLLLSMLFFVGGIHAQDNTIIFDGDTITTPNGVSLRNNTVRIENSGTYTLTGTSADAQVVVDSAGSVTLILDNLDLTSTTTAPIYIEDARDVIIELATDSVNTLTDARSRRNDDDDDAEAVIYSESDLSFFGYGTLTINGQYEYGIHTEGNLSIQYGEYFITAQEDGVVGEDSIVLLNAQLTIQAGEKGLKTDDDDNRGGFIQITDSILNIQSGDHGIDAEGELMINDSTLDIIAQDRDNSADGIKAGRDTVFNNVTLNLVASDHGIDVDGDFTLNSGDLTLSVGNKGLNVEYTATINGGTITILNSEEGIEAGYIIVNDGEIYITATDDGINISIPDDDTTNYNQGGQGRGQGQGQMGGGRQVANNPYYLQINGGLIVVDASGDGLDSNGSITMNGGTVIVNGPTADMDGALDFDGTFALNGGLLIAAGSAGMPQAPDETSPAVIVSVTFDAPLAGGTIVTIRSEDGVDVLTFAPSKTFQNVILSAPELIYGETYTIHYGGESTGTATNGLYTDGDYTGGDTFQSFTIGDGITTVGASLGRGRGR